MNIESPPYSFRFGQEIVGSVPELNALYEQVLAAIDSVTEEHLIKKHLEIKKRGKKDTKSLSKAINELLDQQFVNFKWTRQSKIFSTSDYAEDKKSESVWTLDFSKEVVLANGDKSGIAVEVAFNHGEAAAWNLVKPVLAAEINDMRIETQIGEGVGIIIVASSDLKKNGAFDGAVGTTDRYVKTLKAMRSQLTTPIILMSLAAPKTFRIVGKREKIEGMKHGDIFYF